MGVAPDQRLFINHLPKSLGAFPIIIHNDKLYVWMIFQCVYVTHTLHNGKLHEEHIYIYILVQDN